MTLYELTGEYLELLNMAEDPETDPQALADTLDSLSGEIEDKAYNCAKAIKEMEKDAKDIGDMIKSLQARKNAIERNAGRTKKYLQMAMEATGKKNFKTPLFSIGIQKNPPHVVMDTLSLMDIPTEYLVPHDPTIDKKEIMEVLKTGATLPFAHLEQDEGLRIR